MTDLAEAAAGEPPPSGIVGRFTVRLPINLRGHFEAASLLTDAAGSAASTEYVSGLGGLIVNPERVLNELDAQEIRHL